MGKQLNQIKSGGDDGLRLQVTLPARDAGLVEGGKEPASVYVWAFDGLLVVLDESVDMGHRADLVSTAAGDSGSIYGGRRATIAEAGHGYQVQLPGAQEAGFGVGDDGHTKTAPGLIVIHDRDRARLAGDLETIRREQSA